MKKIVLIFIMGIIILTLIYVLFFRENKEKEINIVVMREHYEEMRGVLTRYGKAHNIKINIMNDDFLEIQRN